MVLTFPDFLEILNSVIPRNQFLILCQFLYP